MGCPLRGVPIVIGTDDYGNDKYIGMRIFPSIMHRLLQQHDHSCLQVPAVDILPQANGSRVLQRGELVTPDMVKLDSLTLAAAVQPNCTDANTPMRADMLAKVSPLVAQDHYHLEMRPLSVMDRHAVSDPGSGRLAHLSGSCCPSMQLDYRWKSESLADFIVDDERCTHLRTRFATPTLLVHAGGTLTSLGSKER